MVEPEQLLEMGPEEESNFIKELRAKYLAEVGKPRRLEEYMCPDYLDAYIGSMSRMTRELIREGVFSYPSRFIPNYLIH